MTLHCHSMARIADAVALFILPLDRKSKEILRAVGRRVGTSEYTTARCIW